MTHRFEAVFGIMGVLGALLLLPSAISRHDARA
jgi:hypothetical protein